MSKGLPIDRERHGNVEILRPRGEIDLNVSPTFRRVLLDCLNDGREVVVDMAGVAYIDSSGIASLAEALHTSRRRGLRLALAQLPESVLKVLRIARLDQVFPVQASPDPSFGDTR